MNLIDEEEVAERVINLGFMPIDDRYFTYCELGEDDFAGIPYDRIWCWYAHGDYEGSGWALVLLSGKFHIESLSHCSCYGPTERIVIDTGHGYSNLHTLAESLSSDALSEVEPLLKLAGH